MKNKQFSLIELMTVIIVILVLITLAIPSLNKLRLKARTIVCANQLKQLGVLLSTYANDNNGRLPYSRNNPNYSVGSYSYKDKSYGKLYGSWAGHLIPYFDIKLTTWDRGNYYHDGARQGPGYSIVFTQNTDNITSDDEVSSNENHKNWKLLNDMFYEGGYGDLKMFICPEAVTSYNALAFAQDRNIPRVSGIMPPTSGYGLYGLPSSYLANGQLFSGVQSKRIEDVNKTNYLLLEGCDHFSQYLGGICTPADYKKFFELTSIYGGSVNNVISGWGPTAQSPSSLPSNMAASFYHDNTEEVWYSWRGKLPLSDIYKYNNAFYPYAAASYMWDASQYKWGVLTSNQYPGEEWQNFELPFTKGNFNIYRYYSKDQKANYMFGEMNLLMADLSVKKSHIGWMFENAKYLGVDTSE